MALKRKWIWSGRLACVLISGIILWRILHSVHLAAVLAAFRTMRPGWFIASLVLYGVLFIPVALRWHLVLRLADAAVSPEVTFRYTLIGHFFYTFLFGAIGGDSAKTALYARRFGIPFPRLLATAPVDRFLGTGSTVLFALAVIASGASHLPMHLRWTWIVPAGLGILILFLLLRRLRFAPYQQFVQSFLRIAKVVFSHRPVLFTGVACGVFAQVAISAVLAFNLLAVFAGTLPLARMLWTFPAVVAISALPISIGGLGTRETAAVLLFGLYGVSPAAAASASLLTFTASFFWAVFGVALIPIRSPSLRNAHNAGLAPVAN